MHSFLLYFLLPFISPASTILLCFQVPNQMPLLLKSSLITASGAHLTLLPNATALIACQLITEYYSFLLQCLATPTGLSLLEDGDHAPCCFLTAGVEYISCLLSYQNRSSSLLFLNPFSPSPNSTPLTSHRLSDIHYPPSLFFLQLLSQPQSISSTIFYFKKRKSSFLSSMSNSSYILAEFQEGVKSFTITASASSSLMTLCVHSRLVSIPLFQWSTLPPRLPVSSKSLQPLDTIFIF